MATYWRGFGDPDGISDWTEIAVASGQSDPAWSVINTDQLQATSASSHNEALVWNDIDADGDRDDFEILCQVYADATTASQRVLCGRVSTSGSTRNGYALRLRTNSVDTYRFSGSTFTQITAGTFSVASGTWVWVRFRVNGSTIRARAWADGDSEPGTWQCDATDTTYTTLGHVGALKGGNTNTQLWRYFGVGTNGDTAPASAGSSVTIALTGIAATMSAGALVPSVSLALGSESAIFSAGTVVPSVAIAAIGLQATFSPGTLTPSSSSGDTVALTGEAATFAQTAPSISVTIALTGITATMASGLLSASSGTATITVKAGSWLRYKKLQ